MHLAVRAASAAKQSSTLLLPSVTQSSTAGKTLTRDKSTILPYIKRTITLRIKNMAQKRSSFGLTEIDLLPHFIGTAYVRNIYLSSHFLCGKKNHRHTQKKSEVMMKMKR